VGKAFGVSQRKSIEIFRTYISYINKRFLSIFLRNIRMDNIDLSRNTEAIPESAAKLRRFFAMAFLNNTS